MGLISLLNTSIIAVNMYITQPRTWLHQNQMTSQRRGEKILQNLLKMNGNPNRQAKKVSDIKSSAFLRRATMSTTHSDIVCGTKSTKQPFRSMFYSNHLFHESEMARVKDRGSGARRSKLFYCSRCGPFSVPASLSSNKTEK